MNTDEARRSNRYADFLPISITIRRKNDLTQLAGPLSARIIDVSNHGACLMLTQVIVQSYHIFHSTREDGSILALNFTLPSYTEPVEIMSKPIWLNATNLDDLKTFKMGVDFTRAIDDNLLHEINKHISNR